MSRTSKACIAGIYEHPTRKTEGNQSLPVFRLSKYPPKELPYDQAS